VSAANEVVNVERGKTMSDHEQQSGQSGDSNLAARVNRLEDIEAIHQLRYEYATLLDEGVRMLGLEEATRRFGDLFTEDTSVNFGAFGSSQGKAGIAPLFTSFQAAVVWTIHYITNPVITVNGDHATGRWSFYSVSIWTANVAAGPQPLWGRYQEEYTRTPDGWRFNKLVIVFDAPAAT
jgi:hypothetical protein